MCTSQFNPVGVGVSSAEKRRRRAVKKDRQSSTNTTKKIHTQNPGAPQIREAGWAHLPWLRAAAILEGIARGERAVLENRTLAHAEARERLGGWLA
jgi:hypothetical protein